MNTRCDSLFVEFEFSSGEGDTMRIYRVMRQYARKRDKEARTEGLNDTLKVKKCSRCVENGEEIMLCAEKSFDVTQKVRSLLGLTMDDFVHSVVLPQGQFAEFLNMTGKDRRDMLERLFHLEAFGKRLSERVRDREQAVSARLGEARGRIARTGRCERTWLEGRARKARTG